MEANKILSLEKSLLVLNLTNNVFYQFVDVNVNLMIINLRETEIILNLGFSTPLILL